ncbi:hypothetical protein ALC57_07783 [Trachymyrmex cornetzi]|uniref:SWIM-type domain-containing protein n=1 Tax=Trachymyrmex cornetzi TaxID=471704 RepID=A0A151J7I9_9HYME|nr:hypothetical protein ALC57_07783 [Trachymyrmex cornetzi]
MERELIEQAALLGTREKYIAWEQRCDNFIESVEEQSRAKRPRLSIGKRQSVITCIARLESLKDTVRGRFVHVGAGYGLRWREIETAFESRILTGAVINSGHIEPRQFLENACEIVLKRVQDAIEKHGSVKVNTAFNGEFVAGDKHAIKSITTKNFELYQESNVHECSCEKLQSHEVDCEKMNDCVIRLPRTTCDAHTTIHCHHITSVAITIASRGSRVNSKTWHIATSLEKLTSYLDKDKLKIIRSEFSTLSDEEFELLTRKDVFPYE